MGEGRWNIPNIPELLELNPAGQRRHRIDLNIQKREEIEIKEPKKKEKYNIIIIIIFPSHL